MTIPTMLSRLSISCIALSVIALGAMEAQAGIRFEKGTKAKTFCAQGDLNVQAEQVEIDDLLIFQPTDTDATAQFDDSTIHDTYVSDMERGTDPCATDSGSERERSWE